MKNDNVLLDNARVMGDITTFIHTPTGMQQSAAGCLRCVEVRKVKLVTKASFNAVREDTVDEDQNTHARLGVSTLH